MSIHLVCPGCQAKFHVGDELSGRRIKCPKCRAPVAAASAPTTATVAAAAPQMAKAPSAAAQAQPVAAMSAGAKPASASAKSSAPAPVAPEPAAPKQSSAPIAFACPHCGQRLQAPAALAGKQAKCNKCQQPVAIPAPAAPPVAAPKPSAQSVAKAAAPTKPAAPIKPSAPAKPVSAAPDLGLADLNDDLFSDVIPAAAPGAMLLHKPAAAPAASTKKKKPRRQFSLPRVSLAVPGMIAGVISFFAAVGALVWGMYGMGIIESPSANLPPTIPEGFLFRAVYDTTEGEITNRCMFAVQAPGISRTVLLTSLQTFTTQGEFKHQIPADELPQSVRGAKLSAEFGLPGQATADAVIPLTGAQRASIKYLPMFGGMPEKNAPGAGDIAALWGPPAGQIPALRVAGQEPILAETLWLYAHLDNVIVPTPHYHRATAVAMKDDYLVFALHTVDPVLRHTEGSPLLNRAGEVVAIYVAELTGEDGKTMCLGTPFRRFAPALQKALQDNPPPEPGAAPAAAQAQPPAAAAAPGADAVEAAAAANEAPAAADEDSAEDDEFPR